MSLKHGQRGHCSRELVEDRCHGLDPDPAVASVLNPKNGVVERPPAGRRIIVRSGTVSPREQYFSDVEKRIAAEGDWLSVEPLAAALSKSRARIYELTRFSDRGVKSVVGEIRAVLAQLIESLESLDLKKINTYSGPLSGVSFWNGLALLSESGFDVAGSSASEIRDVLRVVHESVLRALRLVVPNECSAFKVWLSRNISPDSLRRKVMLAMGDKLAGNDFTGRDVQGVIKKTTGEEVDFKVLSTLMQQLRVELEGAKFSIETRPSGDGCTLFNRLVSAHPNYPIEVLGEEMALMVYGEKFFAAKRDAAARKIYCVLAKRGKSKRMDTREVAALAFGVKDPSPEYMKDHVFAPLFALARRINNDWSLKLADAKAHKRVKGGKVQSDVEVLKEAAKNEYTVRRIRRGRGSQPGVSVSIENRLEAMEKWVAEMAGSGTLLEKILWIMFGFGLGKEFTVYDLAELLNKDGVSVTADQVSEALLRGGKGRRQLTQMSRGTLFGVSSRSGSINKKDASGATIHNVKYYSILM